MRLFWKLFCSMVAMTALACSISGFLLIDGQFRSGLDAQAEIAVTEHTILRRMLLREMQFSRSFSHADVARLAEDSAAYLSRGGISFRLSREDGQTLSGIAPPAASALTSSLSQTQLGWEVLRAGSRFYLHAASPLEAEDGTLFLET